MQDRPTGQELLAAVREFLRQEIIPTIPDQRLRFRALIAANVLGIVEREMEGEEDRLREEWRRLAVLGSASDGHTDLPDSLAQLRGEIETRSRALCERIRAGEADREPWRREVFAYVRWSVREKLRISNPAYRSLLDDGGGVDR